MSREGRSVPASHGVDWLRGGIEAVTEAPLTWFGITALFMLMALALNMVPLAGFLWPIAVPMFIGGLMLGCHEARHGGPPLAVRHLFIGCQAPLAQPLAILGLIQFGLSLVITLPAVGLLVFGSVASATLTSFNTGLGIAGFVVLGIGVLLMFVASVAITMAMWFSPALVAVDRLEPVAAISTSFGAARRNLGAFIVYALSICGVSLVLILPLLGAVAMSILQGTKPGGFAVVAIGGGVVLFLIGILLLMPVTFASIYASYRDVFDSPER